MSIVRVLVLVIVLVLVLVIDRQGRGWRTESRDSRRCVGHGECRLRARQLLFDDEHRFAEHEHANRMGEDLTGAANGDTPLLIQRSNSELRTSLSSVARLAIARWNFSLSKL